MKNLPLINLPLSISGSDITRASQVDNLGIFLDDKLCFETQIEAKVLKAFRMLGFLLRVSKELIKLLKF